VCVRLAGDPAPFVAVARAVMPSAGLDDGMLIVHPADVERDTPQLIAALAAAGARILEVRPDVPALEDVYLHLMERGPES
jgi:hypothetical protein